MTKQEDPRDVYEARIKDLVRQKVGREITVLFDYTTRFVQNPYYQADIDDIEVRHPGDDNDNNDGDGDGEDDDEDEDEDDDDDQDL